MINSEIEKKFLFDLEMGRFDIDEDSRFIIFTRLTIENMSKLARLLKICKYKELGNGRHYGNPYDGVEYDIFYHILLNPNNKNFMVYRGGPKPSINNKITYNHLPEYVDEYKIYTIRGY